MLRRLRILYYAAIDIVGETLLSARTVLLKLKLYVTSVVRQIQSLVSYCVIINILLVIAY